MADQSAEHGRRIDEDLDDEVENLVVTAPFADPDAEQQHRELLERSEVARFLRPSALPTDAAGLLAVAREEQAPDPVLAELGRLPAGPTFATTAEVWEALGHPVEQRGDAAPTPTAPVHPLRPDPGSEPAGEPAAPAAPITPSVEDARLHPVRAVVGLGLELVRAGLSTAERAVAAVQQQVER